MAGADERRRVREKPRQIKRAIVAFLQLATGGEEDAHDAALCGQRLDLLVTEIAAGRVIVEVLDERAALVCEQITGATEASSVS